MSVNASAPDQPEPRQVQFSFSVAGTQKSGTSSLSTLLNKHRRILRAPRKEMHFFDDESRNWDEEDFATHSVTVRGRYRAILGDATPLYLWWPQALERMHRYNPDTKIIGIFRDPIERLFSQWMMVVNRWPDQAEDWPSFITRFAPEGLEDRIPDGVPVGAYRMHSGVVRGYYGAQVERAQRIFGADQVHLVEFRTFLKDHVRALDSITGFLGIPPYKAHPPLPHGMKGKPGVQGTPPTAADIEGLVDRYRDDFLRFRELSGLDVSAWPTQQILAGELTSADLASQLGDKVRPAPTVGPSEA